MGTAKAAAKTKPGKPLPPSKKKPKKGFDQPLDDE
jgi:hypothetical protein